MPGPLHFLDDKSRDQIATWLRDALQGRAHVPREYHDQPVSGAISAATPELADQARRDVEAAAVSLLGELLSGRHSQAYVPSLLRLVTELDLRSSAIPILRKLADDIPSLKKRLGLESSSDVLFALLNLRDLHDAEYWLNIWKQNPRCFSPVTLAALFDLDSTAALDFLPKLPNLPTLGDLAALTLDYAADTYQGHERTCFLQAAATAAARAQSHVRSSIETWLKETAPPSHFITRDLARLHDALGPPPATHQRTPAKLYDEAAA